MQAVVTKPLPQLETWCIYVQRQFNTRIVLAAKAGLQNDHTLLTELVSHTASLVLYYSVCVLKCFFSISLHVCSVEGTPATAVCHGSRTG